MGTPQIQSAMNSETWHISATGSPSALAAGLVDGHRLDQGPGRLPVLQQPRAGLGVRHAGQLLGLVRFGPAAAGVQVHHVDKGPALELAQGQPPMLLSSPAAKQVPGAASLVSSLRWRLAQAQVIW